MYTGLDADVPVSLQRTPLKTKIVIFIYYEDRENLSKKTIVRGGFKIKLIFRQNYGLIFKLLHINFSSLSVIPKLMFDVNFVKIGSVV